jgi:hypothetical protein
VSTPPSRKEIAQAVERAAASRLAIYRHDPHYANASNIAERVDGVLGKAEPGQDDWWKVGWVVDAIAEREYDVWYRPRRLRVIERALPLPPPPPAPPRFSQREGDGQWMDRRTGEPLRWPDGRRYEGQAYPAWLL